MSSKGFNLSDHLEQIKTLVEDKSISGFEKIEESVQALYRQLDADNRHLAEKVFERLIRSYQPYVPPGNVPFFYDLAKLYIGDASGLLKNVSKEGDPVTDEGAELAALQSQLSEYSALCIKMKCDPKKALMEDLTEKGNVGQGCAQMNLSTEEYLEMCGQLLGFVQPRDI